MEHCGYGDKGSERCLIVQDVIIHQDYSLNNGGEVLHPNGYKLADIIWLKVFYLH